MIYQVRQKMSDPPVKRCPECGKAVVKLISAPNLNIKNYSSPTEAKYAKMTDSEEIARENILQKEYQKIWLPPQVKHNPWGD